MQHCSGGHTIMAYPSFPRESTLDRALARVSGARRLVRHAWERILDRVPADCALCGGAARGQPLCDACRIDVTRTMAGPAIRCPLCALALTQPTCPDCSARAPAFDQVIAAFDYAAPADLLIQQFKQAHRFSHARVLADMLAQAVLARDPALPQHTIMVPVPASRVALRRRGFNPAAELARGLAHRLPYALRPELLRRVRDGVGQTGQSRAERMRSVAHLYRCPERVENASVAIVDDVLTTGSTLNSIAGEFKAAGASYVVGLVAARTPYSVSK